MSEVEKKWIDYVALFVFALLSVIHGVKAAVKAGMTHTGAYWRARVADVKREQRDRASNMTARERYLKAMGANKHKANE